ncbi:MAG: hypothetical protein WD737_14410 [Gemmatimonadota bacterium]
MTERRLATFIAILVAASIAVPFTLLSGVPRLSGAFLFWTIFALVVISLIFVATAGWKRER